MSLAREFTSAQELMDHYRALRRKYMRLPIAKIVRPAKPVVRDIIVVTPKKVDPAMIGHSLMKICADHVGVPVASLSEKRRLPVLVLCRHAFAVIASLDYGLSYPRIGQLLNRDHSTVCHGMSKYFHGEKKLCALVEAIRSKIE